MRVGIGYDIHRIAPTLDCGRVWIGGIAIPCHYQVEAHSDGDVVLHACTDALLGALALGDIGQHFPDSDPANRNRASSDFVRQVLRQIHELKWIVYQVDSIVMLEQPMLLPHADKIRLNLAQLLGIELSNVSLKAKSAEGLGVIGERKGIASYVVATLEQRR